jgi:CAAX prenyl protease-like protein
LSVFPGDLRSPSPCALVRGLLLAEVGVFIAAVAGCIWLTPHGEAPLQWYHVVLWSIAGCLPILANLIHGDHPRDSGLRVDNLAASALQVGGVTVSLGMVLVIVGLFFGGFDHPTDAQRVLRMGAGFVVGGLVQQYALQAFVLRRLRQAGLPSVAAVTVAVLLFAAVHWPNWVLVGLTIGGGMAWCAIFLRRPNLLTLGISHGLLALLAYHALPRAWHWGLAIGPKFFDRADRFAP